MPLTVDVPSAAAMRAAGAVIAELFRPGDLVLLLGGLGAGKTTLTQGIGAGLGVRGPVLSPTFVIARAHAGGRLPLVHVDAYRLGGIAELDDLDLDTALPDSVTVVEWGEGLAEGLAESRLEIRLEIRPVVSPGPAVDPPAETRRMTLRPVGERWAGVALGAALRRTGLSDPGARREDQAATPASEESP